LTCPAAYVIDERRVEIFRRARKVRRWRNYLSYLAVVWLATINSVALASEAIHGRLIGTDPIDAILM
jgi:hypothetical protein